MNNKKTAVELAEEVFRNNWKLMNLLAKMTPDDQLIYLPKVQKIINETSALLDNMKNKKETQNDIPEVLFRSPNAK